MIVDGSRRNLSPICCKRLYICAKDGENTRNHIERYGSFPINSPKKKCTQVAKIRAGKKKTVKEEAEKIIFPLYDIELNLH